MILPHGPVLVPPDLPMTSPDPRSHAGHEAVRWKEAGGAGARAGPVTCDITAELASYVRYYHQG